MKIQLHKKIIIESAIGNLRVVENAIDEISKKLSVKKDNYGKILLSTIEAVNNAIVHGNKADANKFVNVEILFKKNELIISVSDEGKGFKPEEVPDPTKPENIENLQGRGVFLMSKLSDRIEFNEIGNKVTMIFKDISS